jgi:hypothetical protein
MQCSFLTHWWSNGTSSGRERVACGRWVAKPGKNSPYSSAQEFTEQPKPTLLFPIDQIWIFMIHPSIFLKGLIYFNQDVLLLLNLVEMQVAVCLLGRSLMPFVVLVVQPKESNQQVHWTYAQQEVPVVDSSHQQVEPADDQYLTQLGPSVIRFPTD